MWTITVVVLVGAVVPVAALMSGCTEMGRAENWLDQGFEVERPVV